MTAPETVEIQTEATIPLPELFEVDVTLPDTSESYGADTTSDLEFLPLADDLDDESLELELEIALYEARQGNQAAATFLMNALASTIISGGVPHDANAIDRQDYIQTVNEKIVRYMINKPCNFTNGNIRGYVHVIAHNAMLDMMKKKKRVTECPLLPEDHEFEHSTYDNYDTSPEAHAGMVSFLEKSGCTADQITAILLYHVYNHTDEEIAYMTGTAIGTVRTRIHRGLASVRKTWGYGNPKKTSDNQSDVRDTIFSALMFAE